MHYLPQAVEDVLGDVARQRTVPTCGDAKLCQILGDSFPADVLKPVLGLGEAQTPAICRP